MYTVPRTETETDSLREPNELGKKASSWKLMIGGLFVWTALVVVVTSQASPRVSGSLGRKEMLLSSRADDVMARMDIVSSAMDTGSPAPMKVMSNVVRADNQGATSTWIQIPGKLKHVSMARNGAIWGVNGNDDIYHSPGFCNGQFSGWNQIPGKLMQVSVGGNNGEKVIGVNSGHTIYERHGISGAALGGTHWGQVAGGLTDVSTDNTATWGVNVHHQIYERTGPNSWHLKNGALVQINVGGAHVVGTNSAHGIYTRLGSGWKKLPGAAICASQASDGEMWVVNSANNIYRWVEGSQNWVQIGGGLKQIHVASATQIIGVNSADDIYMRQ